MSDEGRLCAACGHPPLGGVARVFYSLLALAFMACALVFFIRDKGIDGAYGLASLALAFHYGRVVGWNR